jgi:K+/H+ antiporter YhaU regulatory subunit KhtT
MGKAKKFVQAAKQMSLSEAAIAAGLTQVEARAVAKMLGEKVKRELSNQIKTVVLEDIAMKQIELDEKLNKVIDRLEGIAEMQRPMGVTVLEIARILKEADGVLRVGEQAPPLKIMDTKILHFERRPDGAA